MDPTPHQLKTALKEKTGLATTTVHWAFSGQRKASDVTRIFIFQALQELVPGQADEIWHALEMLWKATGK